MLCSKRHRQIGRELSFADPILVAQQSNRFLEFVLRVGRIELKGFNLNSAVGARQNSGKLLMLKQ